MHFFQETSDVCKYFLGDFLGDPNRAMVSSLAASNLLDFEAALQESVKT